MKTMLNIKTDKEVKEDAQQVARELGLPLSTILNAYLKEFIRTKEARFSAAPRMTPKLEKLVKAAQADFKKKRSMSAVFASTDEAIAYLKN